MSASKREERIGERRQMNDGGFGIIDEYIDYNNIVVKFDNGVIKKCNYQAFKNGRVSSKFKSSVKRVNVGDIYYNNKGLRMKVVKLLGTRSIVVFDDGTKRECNNLCLKSGSVSHPDYCRKRVKVGDIYYNNKGMRMRVIKLLGKRSIICFDDGVKRECDNHCLKTGAISHPNDSYKYGDKSRYIGMTSKHTSGELMRIKEYFCCDNITIEFEDGTIVYNKCMDAFRSGEIAKNEIDYESVRVGESIRHSNGMLMTIIAYRRYNDIDIMFEDGIIVYHKRYSSFKNKEIKYPFEFKLRDKTGERRYNNSGLGMTIKRYGHRHDIDVICDDGTELNNVSYSTFESGNLGHKGLRVFRGKVKEGNLFSSFQVKEFVYRLKKPEDVYYICECTKCGYRDILTPTEMLNHKCKE